MSNSRLRAAIVGVGLNPASVAERVGVDPKTVERWITKGRVPHRAHRLTVADLVGKDETYLWPSTADSEFTKATSQAEVVAVYPIRGSIPTDMWLSLIGDASEAIDMLAYSASFFHDVLPEFVPRLAAKAQDGVQIRLLYGDPDCDAVALRGVEEGAGDMPAARCRMSWSYFEPLVGLPNVLARQHGTTLYASVFRFDDTLLVNTHTYGAPGSRSPVLHLQRLDGGRLFTHYMDSFARVWASASSVGR
jgi:hypothetical protein